VPDALVIASNTRGRAVAAVDEGDAGGPAAEEGIRSLRRVQSFVGRKFGHAEEADGSGAAPAAGGLLATLKAKLFPPPAPEGAPASPVAAASDAAETPKTKALRTAEAVSALVTDNVPVSPLTLFLAMVALAVSVTAWFPALAAAVPIGLGLAGLAVLVTLVGVFWRRSPLLLALLAGARPWASAPDLGLEAAEAAVQARAAATEAKAAHITKVRGLLEAIREELHRATASAAEAGASDTLAGGATAAVVLAEAQRNMQEKMRELIAEGVLPDVSADMDARRKAAAVAASKEEWRARADSVRVEDVKENLRVLAEARSSLYPRRTSDLKRKAELGITAGHVQVVTPRTGVTAAQGTHGGSESSFGIPPRRRSSKARPPPRSVGGGSPPSGSGTLRHSFPVTSRTTKVA